MLTLQLAGRLLLRRGGWHCAAALCLAAGVLAAALAGVVVRTGEDAAVTGASVANGGAASVLVPSTEAARSGLVQRSRVAGGDVAPHSLVETQVTSASGQVPAVVSWWDRPRTGAVVRDGSLPARQGEACGSPGLIESLRLQPGGSLRVGAESYRLVGACVDPTSTTAPFVLAVGPVPPGDVTWVSRWIPADLADDFDDAVVVTGMPDPRDTLPSAVRLLQDALPVMWLLALVLSAGAAASLRAACTEDLAALGAAGLRARQVLVVRGVTGGATAGSGALLGVVGAAWGGQLLLPPLGEGLGRYYDDVQVPTAQALVLGAVSAVLFLAVAVWPAHHPRPQRVMPLALSVGILAVLAACLLAWVGIDPGRSLAGWGAAVLAVALLVPWGLAALARLLAVLPRTPRSIWLARSSALGALAPTAAVVGVVVAGATYLSAQEAYANTANTVVGMAGDDEGTVRLRYLTPGEMRTVRDLTRIDGVHRAEVEHVRATPQGAPFAANRALARCIEEQRTPGEKVTGTAQACVQADPRNRRKGTLGLVDGATVRAGWMWESESPVIYAGVSTRPIPVEAAAGSRAEVLVGRESRLAHDIGLAGAGVYDVRLTGLDSLGAAPRADLMAALHRAVPGARVEEPGVSAGAVASTVPQTAAVLGAVLAGLLALAGLWSARSGLQRMQRSMLSAGRTAGGSLADTLLCCGAGVMGACGAALGLVVTLRNEAGWQGAALAGADLPAVVHARLDQPAWPDGLWWLLPSVTAVLAWVAGMMAASTRRRA